MKILLLIIGLVSAVSARAAADEGPVLTAVRNESDAQTVRVALDLSAAAENKVFTLSDPARIVVDFKNIDTQLAGITETIDDPVLKGFRIGRPATDTVRVVLDVAYLMPYEVAPYKGGPSLIVNIPREVKPETKKEKVLPGVTYTSSVTMTADGPLTTHVLDVDMGDPKISLTIATGEDKLGGREKLSEMVKRKGAAIGINGGYFLMDSGATIDMLIVKGKLLILPERMRGFFGIDRDGKAVFMRPSAELSVSIAGGRPRYVNRLNWPTERGEMALFTPEFGASTGSGADRREVIVRNNKIVGFSAGNSSIPIDGFVISADDSHMEFLGSINIGDPIRVIISSYPDLQNIMYGITAGPTLISEGQMQDKLLEDFSITSNIVVGRNPRTAVGRTSGNHLLFVVVEGRSTRSIGMTLEELAGYMKSIGTVDALNLDGGGSSEIVIGERIMNKTPNGEERPLANAFLMYYLKK